MNFSNIFVSKYKILIVLVVAFITMCLASSCKEEEPAIEYKDKEAVEDLAIGWQERFDYENQAATEKDKEEQQKLLLKGCDAELSHVEKYAKEEIKKQGLKDLLVEYIACINEEKDALQDYVSDNDKYLASNKTINNNRRRILTRFVSDYVLTVDEEYQEAFTEYLTNAKTSGVYSKQQEAVNDMVNGLKFEREPADYYGEKYHTYSTEVKNTTNINFERIDIKVKLYNEEGVVVDTEDIYLEDFKADSTEKAEFSSDAEFEKMAVICDSWKEAK